MMVAATEAAAAFQPGRGFGPADGTTGSDVAESFDGNDAFPSGLFDFQLIIDAITPDADDFAAAVEFPLLSAVQLIVRIMFFKTEDLPSVWGQSDLAGVDLTGNLGGKRVIGVPQVETLIALIPKGQ